MSETKKLLVFSTPVIVEQVDDAEAINAELEKLIEAGESIDQGVQQSNAGGGWHSTRISLDWSGDAGRRLIQEWQTGP